MERTLVAVAECFVKLFARAHQTGQGQIHDGVKLAGVVLHRRAGEAECEAAAEATGGGGAARAVVFQRLGFVENDKIEIPSFKGLAVAPEQVVGGEHELM